MKLNEAITAIDGIVPDAKNGLPEEVFLLASRLTPMVNVDLLLKDAAGLTLLSWRDDEFAGQGWHVPGGIIRYKESFEERIQKTAAKELGQEIKFDPVPIAIEQFFCEHVSRGHFISFLFKCRFSGYFSPENKGLTETSRGYLKWHAACPENMINIHEAYRKYI